MPQGLRISCIACLFCNILNGRPVHWCLDCRAFLDLSSCKSDSWRRYICLCWCVEKEVGELVQLGDGAGGLICGTSGTSGRKKLCMVPGHSCHIYGIWISKEMGDALKSSFGVAMQARRKGDIFYGKGGSLLC